MRTGFWWGNLRERVHLEDLGIGGRVILKWILNKYDWRVWTAWNLAGCCEHGNEPSGYIQYKLTN